MTKLFIGGIPYSITTDQLQDIFQKIGVSATINIITDKFTGQSKGFAFAEVDNDDAAQEAIKQLDGFAIEGRKIGVSVARPKEDRPSNGGGGFNRDRNGGDGFQRNNGGFNRNNNRNRR